METCISVVIDYIQSNRTSVGRNYCRNVNTVEMSKTSLRFPAGKSNQQLVQQIEAVTIVNTEWLCYFGIHLQLCPSLALQNHRREPLDTI